MSQHNDPFELDVESTEGDRGEKNSSSSSEEIDIENLTHEPSVVIEALPHLPSIIASLTPTSHPQASESTTTSAVKASPNNNAAAQLRKLLKRETELRLRIDELMDEIANLEAVTGASVAHEPGASAPIVPCDSNSNGYDGGGAQPEVENDIRWEEFEAPDWCIPIKANVLTFDWDELANECQFDVILMDPPWQLATHAPTRGVAIAYQQLPDVCIEELPIAKLQKNGFLFIWVINNKYAKVFDMMKKWGYTYVDDITWVKQTVNRRMAKGHGFYLQHAKETCLVGKKGIDPPGTRYSISSDVIFSERRGQSQKPEELYEMIEELVPDGKYLEIFGRKNNLRDYWVTIGNEL
ncbi:3719_t:CDS:2 [Ambispora leptoticha]|uniref:mRNA m(6)A methyltransferase n=1 Tax=Ambispora leptoticha TaxID=144679 RepID=A0A9N8W6V0_9GLOM|nr:3719_t:CDS:2 [Ambispora leptoticha]